MIAAIIPRRGVRIVAEVSAAVAVVSFAFDLVPWDARPFDGDHDVVGPLLNGFGGRVLDCYEISLPLGPAAHGRMHGVVVVATYSRGRQPQTRRLGRRPILAAATTFAGVAWPATLIPENATTLRGLLLLAAALILLAALRPGALRGSRQALLVGAAVTGAAIVAVSSPSVAKGAFLSWQQWEPYTRDAKPVSVDYVWDSDYDGIDFPKTPTTVFTVKAPRRSPYWRATTLDVFLDDHWREDAQFLVPTRGGGLDSLLNDPLLPEAARDAETWLRQEVTIEALRDSHLVGASVPVAYDQGSAGDYGSGVAYVGRLARDQEYTVYSYAPQPSPAQLARSRANYPSQLTTFTPFLSVDAGVAVEPFGARGREEELRQLFSFDEDLAEYEPLYRRAQEVVGNPRNPYAAAVALEAWFRSSGDFTYDEHPPQSLTAPPLVAFVNGHRRGYCQHFAGAMALMLRYLGIPARVAAGFTTGRYDDDANEFTVANTNAHTWVEVWFRGYGWLPFDPTPGRGRLRAEYTASSLFFDEEGAIQSFPTAAAALGLSVLRTQLGGSPSSDDRDRVRGEDRGGTPGGVSGAAPQAPEDGNDDIRLLAIVLAAFAAVLALFWLVKAGRGRLRYLSDDPRRVAGAVRAELEDYLADQRVRVPKSATPADLSATLRDRLRVDGDRLAAALGEARFAPTGEAEHAARTARRELRSVLRAVRRRLSKKARLRGLVSVRSLLWETTR